MKPVEKLVLGTVQFGLDYGINNQSGKVTGEEATSILRYAKENRIRVLDTSYGYGTSESIIGKILNSEQIKFKIVSKYPRSEKSVETLFAESLSRLGQKKIYGYLVHHFDFYQQKPQIWNEFRRLREENKVSKIGFSLYSVDQLQFLIDNNVDFDILQFPFNIFDQQFGPHLQELKMRGVEIHTRSVFLQGLFFKETSTLKDKLQPLVPYLEKLRAYCFLRNITIEQLALNYVIDNSFIDGLVIGVDTTEQLKANVGALDFNILDADIDFIDSLNIQEKELLNPVNWN